MKQLFNLTFALIFSYAFYQTHFIIGTDLFIMHKLTYFRSIAGKKRKSLGIDVPTRFGFY